MLYIKKIFFNALFFNNKKAKKNVFTGNPKEEEEKEKVRGANVKIGKGVYVRGYC